MTQKTQEITTTNEEQTQLFAAQFAAQLQAGDGVFLWGDLGAGKSVFCRSIIKALSGDPDMEVPSPTYTLVQAYPSPVGEIWHFDLYRLSGAEEVYEIGWEEALGAHIMLVEWPERLGPLLPARRIDVRLEAVSAHPNHRKVSITRHVP